METLDKYFENVCELDIMFNLEKTHFIVDEFISNGCILDANRTNVLAPILLLDKQSKEKWNKYEVNFLFKRWYMHLYIIYYII